MIENFFSFRCLSCEEVLENILAISSNAVGLDDMFVRFVKMILSPFLPYIMHIYNTVLTKSIFPLKWKLAKIIPIPTQNNDFRPIAILPFL